MKTAAIIPAGGSGRRMETDQAKQYLLLDGTPILVHTLKIFQATHLIDDIILVVPAGDVTSVKEMVEGRYGLSKVRTILPGGKERQDSVKNGLDAVGANHDIVVIHDAVRCLVSEEIITSSIEGASRYQAVSIGIPVRDTVKRVADNGIIEKTVARDGLWLTQTPQAFQTDIIKRAYEAAYHDGFYGTDDAELAERLGIKVRMLPGTYENIKITAKDDLIIARTLLKK